MSALVNITAVETKLFLRDPAAAIMTFALPIGLLVIFGSIGIGEESAGTPSDDGVSDAFLPVMALTLSVAMLGFSVLPTVLATYREKGVLRRLSVTPVSPFNVLSAQLLVNLAGAVLASVLVLVLAAAAYDMGTPASVIPFALGFVLMTAAIFTVGLVIAALAPTGKAATSIGMLVFFPSMFFAGVWTPGELMPEWARPIRDVSPMGAGMEAMQESWGGEWPGAVNLIAMVAVTVVAGAAAARFFRWE